MTEMQNRELDAQIAERVMGMNVAWYKPGYAYFLDDDSPGPSRIPGEHQEPCSYRSSVFHDELTPRYSTRIDDAWRVVEAMKRRRFSERRRFFRALDDRVQAVTGADSQGVRVAWPDALMWLTPLIICEAALDAVKEGS